MAGRDQPKPKRRGIWESDRYKQDREALGLNPAVVDRILSGALLELAKDPTLAGAALPPTKSGAIQTWTFRTRRLNAADPILRVYYTFDDERVTLQGLEAQFPPESWRC